MLYRFECSSVEHDEWFLIDSKSIDIIHFKEKTGNWNWYRTLSTGNAIDITKEVLDWLKTNNINDPFENKEDELLFRLTFE